MQIQCSIDKEDNTQTPPAHSLRVPATTMVDIEVPKETALMVRVTLTVTLVFWFKHFLNAKAQLGALALYANATVTHTPCTAKRGWVRATVHCLAAMVWDGM